MHVRKAATLSLDYIADWRVGVGGNQGEVLLEDTYTPYNLHMYRYQNKAFKLQWTKPKPKDVNRGTWKCISSEGDIYLQDGDSSPTYRYSRDLSPRGELQHDGWLLGCLPPHDRLAYRQEVSRDNCTVSIVGEQHDNLFFILITKVIFEVSNWL